MEQLKQIKEQSIKERGRESDRDRARERESERDREKGGEREQERQRGGGGRDSLAHLIVSSSL